MELDDDDDQLINRSDFEYCEQIGEGGCGTVYKATFKNKYKNYTEAAAKVLTTQLRTDEIDILQRLQHDNVVKLIGYYEDGPTKVIFFEYTQFGSLYQYLSKDTTPLPVELQRRWAKEAALAIQYLHCKNILHRDLKASNCLLFNSPTGTLKLCDFGLAKEVDHSQTTSTQKGTYRFWAPEIIRADDRNHSAFSKYTDVWAYGMLLYEICSRRLPFYDKEWQVVIRHVGKGDLLPTIPDDCPAYLYNIMKECWKYEPNERPTINKIAQDLTKAKHWCLCQTINPVHEIHGQYFQHSQELRAHSIACCPDGSMVVADNNKGRQYMVTPSGEHKAFLEYQDDRMFGVGSIAVTQEYIVICDNSYVKIFDNRYRFVNKFQPVKPVSTVYDKMRMLLWNVQAIEVCHLTTEKNDSLVLWDKHQVTWHSCPGGELMKQMRPCEDLKDFPHVATNSVGQLMFYDHWQSSTNKEVLFNDTKVVAIDNSTGKKVFSISPQLEDRTTGRIYQGNNLGVCGLVTDDNDAIYIAMIGLVVFYALPVTGECWSLRGRGKQNTGHIHKYSNTGEFLQCIIRDLKAPHDLAMTSDGSLVIANDKSILIYRIEPAADSQ